MQHRVLVGHEAGSGDAAVRFALTKAALAGAVAVIATTWQYPRDTRATSAEAGNILEQGAAAELAAVVSALRADFSGIPIETVVQLGHPVEVLAQLAPSADLVVIGSRAPRRPFGSGLATLVVGSVAIGLLRRVQTPVVIVPAEDRP